MALLAMDSEPVIWNNGCNKSVPAALRYLAENPRPIGGESSFNTAHLYQLAREIELMAEAPLYRHAQPVPEEIPVETATIIAYGLPTTNIGAIFKAGHDACRAARLKAQPQNAPQNIPEIIPDGWIPVSEHLPKEKGVYQVWNGKYVDNVPFWFGSFQSLHSELITHWMPLPAAPQEVKP